jgi:dTDP-4-amino-4,6-dideoxygalactose transaminase
MKYKAPFVNYPLQYRSLKKEIDGALKRVIERGDLILRKDVQDFEKKFSSFVGEKYGIGVGCCTDGLFLSLFASGIGKGDEVVTVSHTYVATIDTIWACGATPILVDVGDDMEMDVDLIEKAITPKTKAIVPVHLDGRMCNMERVMEIAKKYDLVVIEDAAQSIGAKFKGKKAGSFGLTSCFSFYPAKLLGSYGDAGMICTDDKKLAQKLYLLRDHGEQPGYLRTKKDKDKIHFFGFNSLLDNIQAAVLNVKLKYLPEWIKRRREIASIYHENLKDVKGIIPPSPPTEKGPYFDVFQNYVIRAKKRNSLEEYLDKKGVETLAKWKIPNHLQKGLDIKRFRLPKTEGISRKVISLPMYPELTDSQVKYAAKCVKDFYKK